MKLVIAAFFAAHALIHLSYLTPPPRTAGGPEWPFEMGRSWLVTVLGADPALVRPLGTALVVISVAMFLGAALSTVGWLVPTGWWTPLCIGGAAASIATLGLFFHPWILLGIVIDAVLLWGVLVADWLPASR